MTRLHPIDAFLLGAGGLLLVNAVLFDPTLFLPLGLTLVAIPLLRHAFLRFQPLPEPETVTVERYLAPDRMENVVARLHEGTPRCAVCDRPVNPADASLVEVRGNVAETVCHREQCLASYARQT